MEIEPYETDIFYDKYGLRLWEKRHSKVLSILSKTYGIRKILDIGCNYGKFLKKAARNINYDLLVGMDISKQVLMEAKNNLQPDLFDYSLKYKRESPLIMRLFHGDVLIKYENIKNFNFDVITLIEIIEHLEKAKLREFDANIFGFYAPKMVIVSTPNYDFNYFFQKDQINLPELRNDDHKFEFTREEFRVWALENAEKYNYECKFDGVGLPKNNDFSQGYCSQIAIFIKKENSSQITCWQVEKKHEKCYSEEVFMISYPFEKKNYLTFLRVLKQQYNSLRLMRLRINEARQRYFKRNYPFISIKDLMNISQIQDITNNNMKIFFAFLKKIDKDQENLQFSRNKKALRFCLSYNSHNY